MSGSGIVRPSALAVVRFDDEIELDWLLDRASRVFVSETSEIADISSRTGTISWCARSSRLRSHETRIARQILCPISKIVRRYEHHGKRDAHPMVHSNAESYVARPGKERRHVRRAGFCGQV